MKPDNLPTAFFWLDAVRRRPQRDLLQLRVLLRRGELESVVG